MEFGSIFFGTLLWVLFWGAVGLAVTPRIYLRRDKDIAQTGLMGALVGAALGPVGLAVLWVFTPSYKTRWVLIPGIIVIFILSLAFARADPNNLCVTSSSFVASQLMNGIIIGIIYSLMALGLTLIFSILGIVSFAHGEFYMVGGMIAYFMTARWFPGINPLLAILAACAGAFLIGLVFERIFLQPMHSGEVERPGEYAILVTFGLAFFLQYFVQATVGANPVKASRYFDFPIIENAVIQTTKGNITFFDAVSIPNPRFTAAVVAIFMLAALLLFLYRTWTGKALRAVSEDKQAAAVAGINTEGMNTLAFALGSMLAGLSGAMLVQVFSWLPQVGTIASSRSFVIIVLGGMGSLPGAFIGGLMVGLFEAAGTGCIPDPTRAASYIPAYGMIVLTLILLLKPTGLFGKEL
ncbi:MAG TPA: branched-chain amino acid ABC transporter permease [Anaerolineae bacterium]|nr:branched-chain amino acid ABC transporter permease [Anaerolineae bacterium]HIP73474.1 branched-chain amino acid ABC transporter permease [Anaerolineae bacterium]